MAWCGASEPPRTEWGHAWVVPPGAAHSVWFNRHAALIHLYFADSFFGNCHPQRGHSRRFAASAVAAGALSIFCGVALCLLVPAVHEHHSAQVCHAAARRAGAAPARAVPIAADRYCGALRLSGPEPVHNEFPQIFRHEPGQYKRALGMSSSGCCWYGPASLCLVRFSFRLAAHPKLHQMLLRLPRPSPHHCLCSTLLCQQLPPLAHLLSAASRLAAR